MSTTANHSPVDWETLQNRAAAACERAYAPYSGYRVGAAAELENGTIVTGANVENASYGLTLCAECAVVSTAATCGGGAILHLVCVNAAGEIIPPCGRCRQIVSEHAAEGFLLLTEQGEMTLDEMLPWGFRAARLSAAAGRTDTQKASDA